MLAPLHRLAAILCIVCAPWAAAAQGLGVIAPLSEGVEPLGRQVEAGARMAAADLGIPSDQLVIADDRCTGEGGEEAARRMVEAGVEIAIGFLCTESIEAALPLLSQAGIPVITPGVRTMSLTDNRDRTGWAVFRTAPRADDEREAAARLLIPRWRQALFALVDDGTIYGRELVESFRLEAENTGLEAVFFDTFRPQMENQIGLVGRLRRAGATHVLVGGDRDDIAIMGRDADQLGFDLTIAGGEALLSAQGNDVPLAEGTLMVATPEPSEIATVAVLESFMERGIIPEGYTLPAYSALEIAHAAQTSARESSRSLTDILFNTVFETALGPIDFNDQGDLAANPYRLYRFDGEQFLEVE